MHMPVLRPITAAAYLTGRSRSHIHTWARQGLITSACNIRTKALLVDLVEVARLSQDTPRRRPRSLTPAAA